MNKKLFKPYECVCYNITVGLLGLNAIFTKYYCLSLDSNFKHTTLI